MGAFFVHSWSPLCHTKKSRLSIVLSAHSPGRLDSVTGTGVGPPVIKRPCSAENYRSEDS